MKILHVFELRIGYDCPACGKKNWIGKFDNSRKGYHKCIWCKTPIDWSLWVDEKSGN